MWGHLGYCGPSDKPKTARPRRHAPKLGVCRLMLQPLESLPPWPGESHPTAEIRVCLPRCQGEGLSQASSWRFPPPTARTSERRQGQGPQAWRAIPLSGTAPPHSHRHRHRLHDHGRGLLLGHLLLPPFSLLPTPHGGGVRRKPGHLCGGGCSAASRSIDREEREEGTRRQAGVPVPRVAPSSQRNLPKIEI